MLSYLAFSTMMCAWIILRYWLLETARYIRVTEECDSQTHEWLKSMLSPHMLINAINIATIDLYDDRESCADALLSLRMLLRMMRHCAERRFVSIEQEWQLLEAFLRLSCPQDDGSTQLAPLTAKVAMTKVRPLMFLPLVENAVKHGEGSVGISIDVVGPEISFECRNRTVAGQRTTSFGGHGLPNLRQRLELAYPERHTLRFDTRGSEYIATLRISNDYANK